MKKIIGIITLFAILTISIFVGNSYATALAGLEVNIDKTNVKPGEEVKVTIEFGEDLGAYTFDIAYDENIFEYVSAEGGTANDTKTKVRVTYYDSTGGTNPRSNMSVIFKAKEDITTSNPTEFNVTAEGLANPDASVTYDDVTTPITKNITVEPQYIDYTINLEYTGDIIKQQEKQMTLSYSSPMGHYYEHARLVAEATTPENANVKLIGIDESNLEHDIIQSGWGDAQGYKIGGKDVSQVLNVKGIFSEEGEYKITLKLIDRDNSDNIIAQNTFNINVKSEEQNITTPGGNEEQNQTPETPTKPETPITNNQVEKPTVLPKTGINIYIPIIAILAVITIVYIYNQKQKENE